MLFGTGWKFKFSYFWTAMLPSYVVYLLKNQAYLRCLKFQFMLNEMEFAVSFLFLICAILIVMSLCSIIYLFYVISEVGRKSTGFSGIKINFNENVLSSNEGTQKEKIVDSNGIYIINPNLIEYLLSTLLVSGTLGTDLSNSEMIGAIVFILFQLLLFLYMNNSSTSVPNLVLMLCRKDIIVIDDIYLILVDRKLLKQRLTGVRELISFAPRDVRNRFYVFRQEE